MSMVSGGYRGRPVRDPWCGSMKAEAAGTARADRWGIFVGEWAPTFFALGLALANYERDHDLLHSPAH
ncbi:hypothetical protein [Streptomyces vinaceus]|uniref:hypothetical protein n=1 Tax=Streptomyces vinaceus TaxID=1960 RepID=UPI0005BB5F4A|nr:hypothetical protein [Streptomyces vinaceus]